MCGMKTRRFAIIKLEAHTHGSLFPHIQIMNNRHTSPSLVTYSKRPLVANISYFELVFRHALAHGSSTAHTTRHHFEQVVDVIGAGPLAI